MDPDKLSHVGRGGVGNLMSQQYHIEHQNKESSVVQSTPPTQEPARFAGGGRGGYGNLMSREPAATQDSTPAPAPTPTPSTTAHLPISAGGAWLGRGGAGNWNRQRETAAEMRAASEKKAMAVIDAQAISAVDTGLAAPPKAYSGR